MTAINKIAIIGTGNVAINLALALKKAGKEIVQVYGRTNKTVRNLAQKLSSSVIGIVDLKNLTMNADLYIVSISDSSLSSVLEKINVKNKLIVHTSGSYPMEILKNSSSNYGVLYPLQTFSKNRKIDFEFVPICIEANNLENQEKLINLGNLLSKDIRVFNSEERKIIHCSAVFACNFSNFMYIIAENILKKHNISFDILKTLINETTNKINVHSPLDVHTGPAKRKDFEIIENHLKLLDEYPDYKEIYDLLSKKIIKQHEKRND